MGAVHYPKKNIQRAGTRKLRACRDMQGGERGWRGVGNDAGEGPSVSLQSSHVNRSRGLEFAPQ